MEYNFRTMQSLNGTDLRPYDAAQFEEPCATEVPESFKLACYYEQASWWRASMSSKEISMTETIAKVGKLCLRVKNAEWRDMCFRGIGNTIGPNSEYKADMMRTWCQSMPDDHAFALCYREALGHLLHVGNGGRQLKAVCARDSDLLGDFCSYL